MATKNYGFGSTKDWKRCAVNFSSVEHLPFTFASNKQQNNVHVRNRNGKREYSVKRNDERQNVLALKFNPSTLTQSLDQLLHVGAGTLCILLNVLAAFRISLGLAQLFSKNYQDRSNTVWSHRDLRDAAHVIRSSSGPLPLFPLIL